MRHSHLVIQKGTDHNGVTAPPATPPQGLFIALLVFVKRLEVETLVAFASDYSNVVGP